MLKRRGFTLVELLVAIVLLALVGVTLMKVMNRMLRVTTAQVQLANSQGNARTGTLAIPQELREIGYDTIPLAGQAVTDLEDIQPNRITFRAMRGVGITCGTPTLTEFKIRYPLFGMRDPLPTDGFMLFVEGDPNLALDDTWAPMDVQAIDYSSTCGADKAIKFTLGGAPQVDPINGVDMAMSNFFVGAPVRWYERMEYGAVMDNGRAYIGARSLSLGQGALQPMIGPLSDTTGFALTYYDKDGNVLDPNSDDPLVVRSIGVNVIGATQGGISLAASTNRARSQSPVYTRVALRNTLRP